MATFRKRADKWHAQVRRQGHPTVTRSFIKKVDAEAWARQHESEIERGVSRADLSQLKTLTLASLLKRYETNVSPLKKGCEPEVYRLRAMQAHPIGATTMDKLTTARVATYRDERLTKVCGSSVRRELAILAHCMEVARKEWGIGLIASPMEALTLPAVGMARKRRVAPEELRKLAITLQRYGNPLVVSIINLAIMTGMRRGELLGMRWADVHLAGC